MATDNKTYELSVEAREQRGKVGRKLRREGQVPGVVYGHNVDSESIAVSRRDLEHVYLRAGSNNLVDLKVGGGPARKVFIYKVQRDPVSHDVRHVDFLAVNLREEITASVPLVLIGEAPAVANGEGLLMQVLDSVQVRSLPLELPSLLEVDISGLEAVGDGVHVSNITIPENVTLITSEEDLIARVTDLPAEEVIEVEEAEEAEETEGEGEVEGEETRAEANAEGGDNEELPEETA